MPSVGRLDLLLLAAGLVTVPALVLAAEGSLALLDRGAVTDSHSSGIDRLHRYSTVYGWEPRPGRYVDDGSVITINEVTIVGRVQKPVASVDVSKIQPKLTLAELRQPFLDRIEEAARKDPF